MDLCSKIAQLNLVAERWTGASPKDHFSTTLIFQNFYFWRQISVLKKTDGLGLVFSVLPISWVSRSLVICTEKQVMGHFHNGALAT